MQMPNDRLVLTVIRELPALAGRGFARGQVFNVHRLPNRH